MGLISQKVVIGHSKMACTRNEKKTHVNTQFWDLYYLKTVSEYSRLPYSFSGLVHIKYFHFWYYYILPLGGTSIKTRSFSWLHNINVVKNSNWIYHLSMISDFSIHKWMHDKKNIFIKFEVTYVGLIPKIVTFLYLCSFCLAPSEGCSQG